MLRPFSSIFVCFAALGTLSCSACALELRVNSEVVVTPTAAEMLAGSAERLGALIARVSVTPFEGAPSLFWQASGGELAPADVQLATKTSGAAFSGYQSSQTSDVLLWSRADFALSTDVVIDLKLLNIRAYSSDSSQVLLFTVTPAAGS